MQSVAGILGALLVRERTGRGQSLDATLVNGLEPIQGGSVAFDDQPIDAWTITSTVTWTQTRSGRGGSVTQRVVISGLAEALSFLGWDALPAPR